MSLTGPSCNSKAAHPSSCPIPSAPTSKKAETIEWKGLLVLLSNRTPTSKVHEEVEWGKIVSKMTRYLI